MKVPLSWLAEYVRVPVETRRLADDLTVSGLAVDALETHGAETVLDLDVTTNRVDCMNVYGVAREVATLYGEPLRSLDLAFEESGRPPAPSALDVAIEAPELCPRFCARVLDVRMGPSPQWMRDRLEMVGVRPISSVVDLTNYVMLEMGQPCHAFDLARLPQGRLLVRWAREGERLRTLDGVERLLSARVGVVAGPEGPLALAGIMGGASSEVSDETRTVALEAAYWAPLSIRRAAKSLSMHTEASHRFERGADPEGPPAAIGRIAALLGRIGSGTVRPGLLDQYVAPRARRSAVVRLERAKALIGKHVPEPEAQRILEGLGFRVTPRAGALAAEIPTWRGDVAREEDLIEEIARHHGLASVPSTLPPALQAEGLRPAQRAERRLREALVGAGLTEVINSPLVSAEGEEASTRVALENPLAEDQGLLRSSLAHPGLVGVLRTNLRHGRRDVAVFEVGRVFHPGQPLPREERRLGVLLAGSLSGPHWSGSRRPVDFFDLKGLLDVVTSRLGVPPVTFGGADGVPGWLHPGKASKLEWQSGECGFMGAVHPEAAQAWELRDDTYVAEVSLDGLLSARPEPARYRTLPRSPAVARDVSVACDRTVRAADLEQWVRDAGGGLLRSVSIVDRYEGPPVPEGRVSLTLGLVFQEPSRTLTGDEVQAAVDGIVAALRSRGADIRGE